MPDRHPEALAITRYVFWRREFANEPNTREVQSVLKETCIQLNHQLPRNKVRALVNAKASKDTPRQIETPNKQNL